MVHFSVRCVGINKFFPIGRIMNSTIGVSSGRETYQVMIERLKRLIEWNTFQMPLNIWIYWKWTSGKSNSGAKDIAKTYGYTCHSMISSWRRLKFTPQ